MSGFFTKQETQSLTRPDGKTYSCFTCGLYKKGAETPKMEPSGKFKKGILNIFSAPTETEDEKGTLLHRRGGDILKAIYQEEGISLHNDCLNTTAIKCLPLKKGNVKKPEQLEIDCCRRFIVDLVEKKKPKVIIAHGEEALKSLIGHRLPKESFNIQKWRGFLIPDQDLGCYIAPVYDCSYVVTEDKPQINSLYLADLERALNARKLTFPTYRPPTIKVLNSLKPLLKIRDTFAFDYETTGLKPHAKGHEIVCASVAVNENEVYVFMMPKTEKKLLPFVKLLRNKYVPKMAHNMKFEDTWTYNILKTRVRGWKWDSMLAAHVINNQTGITGLKIQSYLNFGIVDYSSEIGPYLKGSDAKNANSFNKVKELASTPRGREKLLEYCALDSIYEYRLAMLQQEIMDNTIPF